MFVRCAVNAYPRRTLPFSRGRTIFDLDIESMHEKPWRMPGVDLSDYFNFDLHEASWRDYSRHLVRPCLGTKAPSMACLSS